MGDLQGRRILVVEDEAMIAVMLEDVLGTAGAIVVGPVASVSAALAAIDRNPSLCAAVLDINLGHSEHSEPVAVALAERGVPFVVTTGYGAQGVAAAYGAAPVLAKPYDPDQLIATLQKVCPA